ncbi:MAG: 4-(cytidine 5'-diphospho)-2-C-methyl-D-erythritol kinase [Actinomycetota bacterium]|nr:4-(cytidine 5'-diphospho)-2-C-methyl-D-erythritol kinase [Actinomycetota bacterium]
MKRVHFRAFAKVNYALDVLGLRGDGYHEVRTVLQSVSLADEVEIEVGDGGFGLRVEPDGARLGPAEENTAYRAWRLLRELTGDELPVRVRLRKGIPAGAGLGGGSADAAAVLVGLNRLFGLGLGAEDLRELGARVGADVPFCVSGGTALGEGVGELLTPLPPPPEHHLVLTKPSASAATARIYRAYDDESSAGSANYARAVVAALRSGSLRALAAAVGNDLAPVTARIVPEVAALERKLLENGALGASMSGSGTAVYGIFDDPDAAWSVAQRSGVAFSGVYGPVSCGVEDL